MHIHVYIVPKSTSESRAHKTYLGPGTHTGI